MISHSSFVVSEVLQLVKKGKNGDVEALEEAESKLEAIRKTASWAL
jgi:hypothetical protein